MGNDSIFYREYGTGRPVVFLHGIMGCSDFWMPIARKLAKQFRVILPDLPNHGASVFTNSIAFADTAVLLEDFFKNIGLVSPCVVAHSYGAKVTFQMLADGYVFERIVAVDMLPNTTFAESAITRSIKFVSRPLPTMKTFGEAREFFRKNGFNDDFVDFLTKGLTIKKGVLQWKFNTQVIGANALELTKTVSIPCKSEMPVLVLKGQYSDYVRKADFKSISPLFSNISLAEIPDAGHWVQYDQPEAFLDVVYKFLTNNKL